MAAGTLRDLMDPTNGYDIGGNGLVEGPQPQVGDLPVEQMPRVVDQLPPYDPNMDPTRVGGTAAPAPPAAGAWQMPGMAFAPGASQNAPRLFQDPATGTWTLSEHGNFRSDITPETLPGAQQYVTDFWNQFPTGFIQPGQTNYDPNQATTNAQYGHPSNWQDMYTHAGMTPPTQSATPTPLIGQQQPAWPTTPQNTGGPLSELSNPERVNQLSQSSYGGGGLDQFREALKGLA